MASSDITKRNLGFIRFVRNVTTLEKRMNLPTMDGMSRYYRAERPKIEPEDQIVKHWSADEPQDMTTGIFKLFSDVEDGDQYSTGGQPRVALLCSSSVARGSMRRTFLRICPSILTRSGCRRPEQIKIYLKVQSSIS